MANFPSPGFCFSVQCWHSCVCNLFLSAIVFRAGIWYISLRLFTSWRKPCVLFDDGLYSLAMNAHVHLVILLALSDCNGNFLTNSSNFGWAKSDFFSPLLAGAEIGLLCHQLMWFLKLVLWAKYLILDPQKLQIVWSVQFLSHFKCCFPPPRWLCDVTASIWNHDAFWTPLHNVSAVHSLIFFSQI